MIDAISSMPLYIIMPIVLTGYSTACFGVGVLFLKLIRAHIDRVEGISAGTLLATGFILGQAILASIWLFLALRGWLSFRIVFLLSFLFAVGGLYFGRNILAGFARQIGSVWREVREDSWGWQLLAGLVVLMWMLGITSLGRPLAGDGSAFYLALGKFMASSNRLIPMPGFEGFSNVGLQGELHFAALMILQSPAAAKLFSWPTILMMGIMLTSLASVVGMKRRGKWLVLCILFSSTAVLLLSGDGKVDLFGMALGLAAYYWAVQIRFDRTKSVLFLTGLFTGFSIVAKLSYLVVMVPSIGLLVLWGYSAEIENPQKLIRCWGSFVSSSLIILAGLVLAFVPHLIKNGLLFNNPISPIGSGGLGWLNQSWFDARTTHKILLTYPLALTYGSYWAQYGNISPLALAFLPLSFFLPRSSNPASKTLRIVTLSGLVAVGVWVLYRSSVFSPRYMLASLFLLTLLPAYAAEYMSYHDQRPRLLSFSILILAISTLILVGLYLIDIVFFPRNTIEFLKGNLSECGRDRAYSRVCTPMEIINRRSEQGDRVYVASFQHYWLRGDLLQCMSNISDNIPDEAKGDDLWLKLFRGGFRFLLIETSSHKRFADDLDLEHPPKWVELSTLYDVDPIYAYEIKFTHPPSSDKPKTCMRMPSSKVWEIVSP